MPTAHVTYSQTKWHEPQWTTGPGTSTPNPPWPRGQDAPPLTTAPRQTLPHAGKPRRQPLPALLEPRHQRCHPASYPLLEPTHSSPVAPVPPPPPATTTASTLASAVHSCLSQIPSHAATGSIFKCRPEQVTPAQNSPTNKIPYPVKIELGTAANGRKHNPKQFTQDILFPCQQNSKDSLGLV